MYGVEYEIENSAGTQVGRIVDPARLAAETARRESESKSSHLKERLNLTNQPSEHLLLIRGHADVDLRLMMLGVRGFRLGRAAVACDPIRRP